MVFHKVIKNKAYFSRYQVHFRRRREARTDYYARKRLVTQDKNKYMTPKPRFVVRFTNTTVICQIAYAEVDGDKIMAAAYSSELPRYGLKVGLKNYSAAYCTGLLCGRRLLAKLGMDKTYEGNTTVNGEIVTSEVVGTQKVKKFFVPDASEDRLPFRALLDVGIRSTTTGNRVFGALKGCNDAGVDIPHTPKRFPGYDREAKTYSAETHRARIFGEPVAEYMRHLSEEEPEAYNARFSSYVKSGISADDLEDMYTSVHAAIRADPSAKPKKVMDTHKRFQPRKIGLKQRRNRIAQKKAARIRSLTGGN